MHICANVYVYVAIKYANAVSQFKTKSQSVPYLNLKLFMSHFYTMISLKKLKCRYIIKASLAREKVLVTNLLELRVVCVSLYSMLRFYNVSYQI